MVQGYPVEVLINAVDLYSGAPISGDVYISDVLVGKTGQPFVFTFPTNHTHPPKGDDSGFMIYHFPPTIVRASGYAPARVPLDWST
jgi:hypothetical protein